MALSSISPIDGRYSSKTKALSQYFSEYALIKYRVAVEINYLIELSQNGAVVRKFTEEEIKYLKNLTNLTETDAQIVKDIETKGYGDIPATNHDVKAVEYYIKLKLKESSLADVLEYVHLALTSEDINNICYGLMIKDAVNDLMFPEAVKLYEALYNIASDYKDTPTLARTHGQPASPTTFGKEILVFVNRLKAEFAYLYNNKISVKLNGATGGYNAHNFIKPEIDWINFTDTFINKFNTAKNSGNSRFYSSDPIIVVCNPITTQIEPHDSFIRVFDSFRRINNILLDFSLDIWRYISDKWIKQKTVKGEIGSSAMPHKVNPIDFENAEANIGVANALFDFFASKLPISRLQRDLSDSSVQRNIGVAFAHTLVAYQSIQKGLSKIEVDKNKILEDLENNPEVIAEAFQNLLRISGFDKPYEALKEITRGKAVTIEDFRKFANKIAIDENKKKKLLEITPSNYIGLSQKIVENFDPKILR
ncbi:MAG TPA: adenylosuccinate lyase [Spirochaetota bacterium]|jgi:adenylosuccinate lyase|nr:MAG: Adenylosuccinate lyase [Spirochaetes bacterium ADurb.Bin133]HNZ25671.1 adenylosuccinate lyase [Spirochaetota bacterium]HPY86821.1 adenylosuccinate lyase [Spirochaetota bacterium]HQB60652.1 adenylosuccinate lyase [Spirochaetota bacterium]